MCHVLRSSVGRYVLQILFWLRRGCRLTFRILPKNTAKLIEEGHKDLPSRNLQLLAGLNDVRVPKLIAVGLKDLHVLVRVPIELFADL